MLNTKLPLGYGYAISSKGTVITFIISIALFFFFPQKYPLNSTPPFLDTCLELRVLFRGVNTALVVSTCRTTGSSEF